MNNWVTPLKVYIRTLDELLCEQPFNELEYAGNEVWQVMFAADISHSCSEIGIISKR